MEDIVRSHDSNFPEVVSAVWRCTFGEVIDLALLVCLEPSVLFVHLCQFCQAFGGTSDPDIRITEGVDDTFYTERDGKMGSVVLEGIIGSRVFEELSHKCLTSRHIPCSAEVIS